MVLVNAKVESFYDETSQFDWCGSSSVKTILRVWLIGIAEAYTWGKFPIEYLLRFTKRAIGQVKIVSSKILLETHRTFFERQSRYPIEIGVSRST